MNVRFWIGVVVYAFFLFLYFAAALLEQKETGPSYMLYAGFLSLYAAIRMYIHASLKGGAQVDVTFASAFKLGFRMSMASTLLVSIVLVLMPGITDKVGAVVIPVFEGGAYAALASAIIAFILVRTTFRRPV